jgi:hypothetical protein
MRITIIDPIADKRWDDFILGHPDSTIFHHSAWARVLRDRYRCIPMYYVLEGNGGEILAAAPFFRIDSRLTGRRLSCLPCSEYCFPLAYTYEDVSQLLTAVKEEVRHRQVSYIEIRGWANVASPAQLDLTERSYYFKHVGSLDNDLDRLRAGFHKHTRYSLKQTEKSEVTVREAHGDDDLREFHRLSVATRRRLRLLPWPPHFIQAIHQQIINPGHGFLLLAELHGKIIGGSMWFNFKDTVTNKINAWDKEYAQYGPNYLLHWKAMERACEKGYQRFDLGVSNPDNSGLMRFKRHWGTDEIRTPYYYYPSVNGYGSVSQGSAAYRVHRAINHWAPEFAVRLAGRALYRHLG